jgi:hypothetical protein
MQLNLNIGKKTKWTLVGFAIVVVGILIGSIGGFETLNPFSFITVLTSLVGGLLMLGMLLTAIAEDFSGEDNPHHHDY